RPKFQYRMRSLDITIEDLMCIAHELSETCLPISVDVQELRDPDDAVIIGTAIAAKAKIIVSGDLDLLVLKEFANIPILIPTNFLNQPPMNV
ncbi:MAG: putative toxin-antitoxin system toxin component, PIN family, partial [Pseudanabaena sp. CAN_BIN31]|nr:putative toxin-antitoxin system toxin component, PIN family [Pseudanabaena sp. CAN_BIN31]